MATALSNRYEIPDRGGTRMVRTGGGDAGGDCDSWADLHIHVLARFPLVPAEAERILCFATAMTVGNNSAIRHFTAIFRPVIVSGSRRLNHGAAEAENWARDIISYFVSGISPSAVRLTGPQAPSCLLGWHPASGPFAQYVIKAIKDRVNDAWDRRKVRPLEAANADPQKSDDDFLDFHRQHSGPPPSEAPSMTDSGALLADAMTRLESILAGFTFHQREVLKDLVCGVEPSVTASRLNSSPSSVSNTRKKVWPMLQQALALDGYELEGISDD